MRNRKTLILITAIMIIALCFSSCGINVQQGNTNKNNEKAESTKTEEAKEYVIPKVIIDSSGNTAKEFVENYDGAEDQDDFCNKISANSDGTVTVLMTEEQRKRWVDNAKEGIKEQKEKIKGIEGELVLSKDKTKGDFYFKQKSSSWTMISILTGVQLFSLLEQYFTGTKVEDLRFRTVVINIDNGKVLSDTQLGDEADISPEDWE